MLGKRAPVAILAVSSLASFLTACNSGNGVDSNPLAVDTYGLTSKNRIVGFSRAEPEIQTAVSISGLQGGETLLGFDIRPGGTPAGQIIALGSSGRLYAIDPDSGAATLKSTLTADPADVTDPFVAIGDGNFGVDFNPVVDRLRVVDDSGVNLRINVDTGLVTTDGPLNEAGTAKTGVSAAAYTNSFSATCRTALFYVDGSSGTLFTTSDPNNGTLTRVSALGTAGGAVEAFEIATGPDGRNSGFVVLSSGGTTSLAAVDPATGTISSSSAVSGLGSGETLRGLAAFLPETAPAQAVGELAGLTESGKLISFNSAAPQKLCTGPTAISGLAAGEAIVGADLRPATGDLVALTSANKLYKVNTTSAAASLISALSADPADITAPFAGIGDAAVGVDFNPVVDRLRVVGADGQNLRINVDTGAVTTDGTLNGDASSATAAAYTNSIGSAGTVGTTSLIVIDPATDLLAIQNPPNDGTLDAVGALGVDVADASFEINGRTGAAVAALNVAGASVSDLYSINLATGAATRVNGIGTAAGLAERTVGIAYTANPTLTLYGVTTTNRLIRFTSQAPGTLLDDREISGLSAGENVVGIDVRPATGDLIAVTDANRLYRIDPATGAASSAVALVASMGDGFAGLTPATAIGIDFNPVVDRLRIVNAAEQNLRVNVATGQVTTDAALNPVGNVFAAAYSSNFSGTTTTTLFNLDSGTDQLLIQGSVGGAPSSPNTGTLTAVGALGVNVLTDIGDLDIGGGTNGIVLAALQTVGSGSELFRVNLATGAATPVGMTAEASGIGMTGTAPVVGLAIQIK